VLHVTAREMTFPLTSRRVKIRMLMYSVVTDILIKYYYYYYTQLNVPCLPSDESQIIYVGYSHFLERHSI